MQLVIIESPYHADTPNGVRDNLDYARKCIKHSLDLGEAPIASHLLYTQEGILNDDMPTERTLGMNAGYAWLEVADLVVLYIDRGISSGMKIAVEKAQLAKVQITIRNLDD